MVGSQEKGGKKNIILNCVKDLSISQEYVYSIEKKKKKKRTPKEFHCSFFSLTLVYAEKILTTHEKQPCLLCLQSNIVDVILKNNRKYFFLVWLLSAFWSERYCWRAVQTVFTVTSQSESRVANSRIFVHFKLCILVFFPETFLWQLMAYWLLFSLGKMFKSFSAKPSFLLSAHWEYLKLYVFGFFFSLLLKWPFCI